MPGHNEQQCVIAGAGPGGLMLGYLLARAGVAVTVVEKHADFLRDFRGDTVHPSTLEVMHELGILERLLQLPHTRAEKLHAEVKGKQIAMADFTHLKAHCRYIAFMPQWDFLEFLKQEASAYPNFRLIMQAEVSELLECDGRVCGIKAITPDEEITLNADLVVGADGRHSRVRELSGLAVERFGVPSDVLWMKLSHQPNDPPFTLGHGGPRMGIVLIDRGEYWQCGYVVRKGSYDEVKEQGLPAFRERLAEVLPLPSERVNEVTSWDDVFLLRVRIDRMTQWWKPGLLCIGDAAHAMSPIGGVGVNLAIQDAVAAANLLATPLRQGTLTDGDLARVEKRRRFPTRATQKLQLMMKRKPKPGAASSTQAEQTQATAPKGPPGFVLAIARVPILARLAGKLIGSGFRPEHIQDERIKSG